MQRDTLHHEDANDILAERLGATRRARGLSRKAASELSGVPWQSIHRIEREGQRVTVESLFRLCVAYRISPLDIISANYRAEL